MKRFAQLALLVALSLPLSAQTVSSGSGVYSGASVRLTATVSGSSVSLSWTQAALTPDWAASTSYAPGQVICPTIGNAGAYEFFAQSGAGSMVSGTSEPTWPQTLAAQTAADGGIIDWIMVVQGSSGVSCPPVTSNNVYRGTVTGGPYTEIYESSSPITTYTDTPSSAGTYYYVVTAVSSNGESAISNEASASVP